MAKVKIGVSIDTDVLEYIDSFAADNGIPRSGAISVIARQYKLSMESMAALSALVQEIKQTGNIEEQPKSKK